MEPLRKPYWEAVPEGIQSLLTDLGQMPAVQPFYLAGGTAIALRLGHRVSRDLDFFSETDPVDRPRREELVDALSASGRDVTIQRSAFTTLALIAGGHHVEDFSDHMLQTYDKLPAVEDLAAGLFVDYRTAFVLGGSDLDAERARSAKLQAEHAAADAARAQAQAEKEEALQAAWTAQQMAQAVVKEAEQEAILSTYLVLQRDFTDQPN